MKPDHDLQNALFLLRGLTGGIRLAVEALGSPVSEVSEAARSFLEAPQIAAVEASFSNRREALKAMLRAVSQEIETSSDAGRLPALNARLQEVRGAYLLADQVFDYYVDLINTRSERGMGPILRGCDRIARDSLAKGLRPFGIEVPPVLTYADTGQGASILKANMYLWDGRTNPCAVIKCVRFSLPHPRVASAVLHETAHQFAFIRGWTRELAGVIASTISDEGGGPELASLWSSTASETGPDFFAIHQANFASVVGVAEVVAGAPSQVLAINPNDPHLMGFLRVLLGLAACENGCGQGPWIDFARMWRNLYPVELAGAEASRMIQMSLPLLGKIARAISETKMDAFEGRRLSQVLPWEFASPWRIGSLLNNDRSDFRGGPEAMDEEPILTLAAFRIILMFGGRTEDWVRTRMGRWLESLGKARWTA